MLQINALRKKIREPYAKAVFWGLTLIYPFFLVSVTEIMANGSAEILINVVKESAMSFLMPLFLTILLFGVFFFVTKRVWMSAIITAVPFLTLAIINYFRMQFTFIPLTLGDFTFSGDVSALLFFVGGIQMSRHIVYIILICILYALGLYIFDRKPVFPGYVWRLAPLLLIVAVFIFTSPVVAAPVLNSYIKDRRNLTVIYKNNGFLSCFIDEINTIRTAEREMENNKDFSMDELEELISDKNDDSSTKSEPEYVPVFNNTGGSAGKSEMPDIIIVLSESYWDPKQLSNITYSSNPAANFERIAEKSISGYLVPPVFGGRTDCTELEILTGSTVDVLPSLVAPMSSLDDNTLTIASYLKSLGYYTVGLHTFNGEFYRRDETYPKLGFDAYKGLEDIPYEYTLNGRFVPDRVISDWIADTLEESEKPTFIMAITMENHSPYDSRGTLGEVTMSPREGVELTEVTESILSNYVASFDQADKMLGNLIDYLSGRDRPSVVMFFGDHLPFLGTNHAGYVEGGFLENDDETEWTDDDYLKMYTTQFLIWSSESDVRRDAGYVSPYFLSGMTLEAAGVPLNEYYQFLKIYREIMPVSRKFLKMNPDGSFVTEMTKEQNLYFQTHMAYSRSLHVR